jgi:UDP-N-acetylglucosamine:LPS N-acetylglucosamine transferase
MRTVLAVASGGGHWVQLRRLRPAFDAAKVTWVSTQQDYGCEVEGDFRLVPDANMWTKWKLVVMFLRIAWVVACVRPDVVVTTGAAPGYAALLFGRLLGAKTIWIDSIANSETLSTSGMRARRWADVWLTQWEHLAGQNGPEYWGTVL